MGKMTSNLIHSWEWTVTRKQSKSITELVQSRLLTKPYGFSLTNHVMNEWFFFWSWAVLCINNCQQVRKNNKSYNQNESQREHSIVSESGPWKGDKHWWLSSLRWLCPIWSIFPR
jgi:hypothetical protein